MNMSHSKIQDNVLDPSQWPQEFRELKEIDTLLRCGVCYEVMDTAMMLQQCSHNYCSLCIRKYMTFKTECPMCRVTAVDSDLKNNRALDDLIKQFLSVRVRLLEILTTISNGKKTIMNMQVKSDLPPVTHTIKEVSKGKKRSSVRKKVHAYYQDSSGNDVEDDDDDDFVPIKLKSAKKCAIPLSESDSEDSIILCEVKPKTQNLNINNNKKEQEVTPIKTTNTCDTLTVTAAGCSTSYTVSNIPVDPISSSYFKFVRTPQSCQKSDGRQNFNSSSLNTPSGSHAGSSQLPTSTSSRVNCPVCGVSIPDRHINLHLDRCLSNQSREPPRNSSETPKLNKRKTMPKLVYNLLSDKELRKKLLEVGLPTQGSRQTMIKRHQELTLQYNAQCDSVNPKAVGELVKGIQKTEKAKTQLSFGSSNNAGQSSSGLKIEKNASETKIDHVCKQYMKQHKTQFAQLIAETKKRMKKKREEELAKKQEEEAKGVQENTAELSNKNLSDSIAGTQQCSYVKSSQAISPECDKNSNDSSKLIKPISESSDIAEASIRNQTISRLEQPNNTDSTSITISSASALTQDPSEETISDATVLPEVDTNSCVHSNYVSGHENNSVKSVICDFVDEDDINSSNNNQRGSEENGNLGYQDDSALGVLRRNIISLTENSSVKHDVQKYTMIIEQDTFSRLSKDSGACSDTMSEGTAWLSQRAPSDAKTEIESNRSSPNFDLLADMGLGDDLYDLPKSPIQVSSPDLFDENASPEFGSVVNRTVSQENKSSLGITLKMPHFSESKIELKNENEEIPGTSRSDFNADAVETPLPRRRRSKRKGKEIHDEDEICPKRNKNEINEVNIEVENKPITRRQLRARKQRDV